MRPIKSLIPDAINSIGSLIKKKKVLKIDLSKYDEINIITSSNNTLSVKIDNDILLSTKNIQLNPINGIFNIGTLSIKEYYSDQTITNINTINNIIKNGTMDEINILFTLMKEVMESINKDTIEYYSKPTHVVNNLDSHGTTRCH